MDVYELRAVLTRPETWTSVAVLGSDTNGMAFIHRKRFPAATPNRLDGQTAGGLMRWRMGRFSGNHRGRHLDGASIHVGHGRE